jgi:pimeloyl-ACP methyl ester carboxylesterase
MSASTPIFVPGLLCTEILFQQQRAALGCDDRLADTTTHDSITAMAAAALALADGPIVPIGLSMGGYVAQEMARQAPDRVVGMALLSTN